MVKEDDKILLLDDEGIKYIGTIDLIEDTKYFININDNILIFKLIDGYLENDNKKYYCKEYFIENNHIKINFYLNDLKKNKYITKRLIYKILELNECLCDICINLKIVKLLNFINNFNFESDIEIHLKQFILNDLLIELITLRIEEINKLIENLRKEDNFKKKILDLKTKYNQSIHSHNTCCICLEEIKDENKFIINCPNCNQIFCAENNYDCFGFEKFIENDDRCPYCRIDLKEWIKIE